MSVLVLAMVVLAVIKSIRQNLLCSCNVMDKIVSWTGLHLAELANNISCQAHRYRYRTCIFYKRT